MFYKFPVELKLDEVRRVVAEHNARLGSNFFVEKDCGDHVVFNYIVSTAASWPEPGDEHGIPARDCAILRECRGLIFGKDGKVLARRWAKFFNVNEKPWTQAHLIDWSADHVILEKLDGSMITPFRSEGKLRWGTKMGITDVAAPVEEFVFQNPRYTAFAKELIGCGLTPIFEWCSRKQAIVVDYPEDALVLTGVRDNRIGTLLSIDQMNSWARDGYGIPVVRALPGSIENIERFMAAARDLVGAEGYIIRFYNGHMLKVKGAWYCAIHGTKEKLAFEKDVWALVLNDQMDDAMALMDSPDRDRCERFVCTMNREIGATAARIAAEVEEAKDDTAGNKKEFATRWLKDYCEEGGDQTIVPLMFSVWDGRDPIEVVRNYLKKNCSTINKVNTSRPLINGLTWEDYRDRNVILDD